MPLLSATTYRTGESILGQNQGGQEISKITWQFRLVLGILDSFWAVSRLPYTNMERPASNACWWLCRTLWTCWWDKVNDHNNDKLLEYFDAKSVQCFKLHKDMNHEDISLNCVICAVILNTINLYFITNRFWVPLNFFIFVLSMFCS